METSLNPHSLRDRKKEKTRQLLIESALRLVSERGYDGTTVEAIAEAAEVSPSTFFRYFGSKEDVFFPDAPRIRASVEQAYRERGDRSVMDTTRAWLLAALEEYAKDLDALRLLESLQSSVPALLKRQLEVERWLEDVIAAALAEEFGDRPDSLRPLLGAGAVMGIFRAMQRVWLDAEDPEHPSEIIERAFEIMTPLIDMLKETEAAPSEPG